MSDNYVDLNGTNEREGDVVYPQITSPSKAYDPEHEFLSDGQVKEKPNQSADPKLLGNSKDSVRDSIGRDNLNSSRILPDIQLGGSIQARNHDREEHNQSDISMFKKNSNILINESPSIDVDLKHNGSKQSLLKAEDRFMERIDEGDLDADNADINDANVRNGQILPYNSNLDNSHIKNLRDDSNGSHLSSIDSQMKRKQFQKTAHKTMKAVEIHDALTVTQKVDQNKWSYKATSLSIKEKLPSYKIKLGQMVDGNHSQAIMTVVTIYALLASDVKALAFDIEADDAFVVLTCISMALFALELIAASVGKPGYWLSFFFWLDLIATLSLVTDIDPLVEAVSREGDGNGSAAGDTATLARASRGARIGTRAGRMTRVIRLIRLVRVVKLYKSANQTMVNKETTGAQSELQKLQEAKLAAAATKAQDNEDDSEKEEQDINIASILNNDQMESRVGKKLSDITTRKVIILVLIMLFSSVIFKSNTWMEEPDSFDYGLCLVQALGTTTTGGLDAFTTMVEIQRYLSTPLVYAECIDKEGNKLEFSADGYNIETYRKNEKKVISLSIDENEEETGELYLAIYDMKYNVKLEAVLSIVTTFLVCAMLAAGAALFSKMTTDLVITPIEDMIMRVNNITADPLGAAHQEEERLLFEELNEKEQAHKSMEGLEGLQEKKRAIEDTVKPMETAMLESTLSKIGALLALGFGEAGSEIIAKNMALGGDVNPMLPGIKLMSIFGFCDIRNFTDATEVLQEGVMLFVNEIGEIIHGIVDRYSGAANKNIGDAFLLVWKFESDMQAIDKKTGELYAKESSKVAQLADMSVISFLLCIAELRKSPKMIKYNTHKGLRERLGNSFQVRLGMGLHLGYAIEGAIGSYYKIDASYLSPHVKMPERLESSTKAFGVPLLISGALYKALTRATRNYCRQVDWVTMVGNVDPIRLYTVDIDPQQLQVEHNQQYLNQKERKIKRVHERIKRDNLREAAFKCQIQISDTFDQNKDILAMRKPYVKEFFTQYNRAFKLYVKGQWGAAKIGFIETLKLSPCCIGMDPTEKEELINAKLSSFTIDPENANPIQLMILENTAAHIEPVTDRLLKFMAQTQYTPPSDWKGYKFFGE